MNIFSQEEKLNFCWRAFQDATAATLLDPSDGLGYLARGRAMHATIRGHEFLTRDRVFPVIREDYLKASRLMPGDPLPYSYLGDSFHLTGPPEKALEYARKAYNLDPLDLSTARQWMRSLGLFKRYEEAAAVAAQFTGGNFSRSNKEFQLQLTGDMEGNDVGEVQKRRLFEEIRQRASSRSRTLPDLDVMEPVSFQQAGISFLEGDYERAAAEAQEAWEFIEGLYPPGHEALINLGHSIRIYQRDPKALELHDELLESRTWDGRLRAREFRARYHLACGNTEAALDDIEYLLKNPGPFGPADFLYEPPYEKLFGEPRFRELLRGFYSDEVIDNGMAWVQKRIDEYEERKVESLNDTTRSIEEIIQIRQEAHRRDPLSLGAGRRLCQALIFARRYKDSIEVVSQFTDPGDLLQKAAAYSQFQLSGNIEAYNRFDTDNGDGDLPFQSLYRFRQFELARDIAGEDLPMIDGNLLFKEPLSLHLAESYFYEGDFERASEEADKAWFYLEDKIPNDSILLNKRRYQSRTLLYKRDPRALEMFSELLAEGDIRFSWKVLYNRACFHLATGDVEAALDDIEVFLQSPGWFGPAELLFNPPFDKLFDEPRFREILREWYSDEVIDNGMAWVRERIREYEERKNNVSNRI